MDRAGVPPKGKGRQVIVGKMFGVSQKGARKWLEGEAIPDTKRIPEIAKKLGVRGEWLLTGMGSMTVDYRTQKPAGGFVSGVRESASTNYLSEIEEENDQFELLHMAIDAVNQLEEQTGRRFSARQRVMFERLIYQYLMVELEIMAEMEDEDIAKYEPYFGDFENLISIEKVKEYARKKKKRAA